MTFRISVLAAALLVLGTTACGAAETTPVPAAPASGAFPVTFTHAFGSTTIPAEPKRVVAVGFNEADFVLALGVVPIGVRDFIGGYDEAKRPWARAALAGASPELVGGNDIDFEKVAALQPDLIMGVYSFMDRNAYDTLTKIAPTVAQPSADGASATWQEQTRTTGKALGRAAEAEQVIADTEKKFADAKARYPQLAGKDVAFDLVVDGVPYRLGADDLRSQVFQGLGITVPATTATLSNETQSQLDKDAIVVIGATREQMAGNAVFQGLKAVKAGKVVYTGDYDSEFAGAIGFGSPLSLPVAIDDIAPKLAAVLQ
ncbi:MAG: iron-siderophore transport system substrate-binding protein [Pseudonocardiales bacterium]|nr:iron-siderophore transport system substrate-binding protein [Pseudonocardiales bacterium]